MAKTALYSVSLSGNTATVQIGQESPLVFEHGANVWDVIAWAHGIKQKVGDAMAIARDVETGRSATDGEKIARALAVGLRLMAGDWRAPAGEGGPEGGLLFRALVELGGKPETVRAKLDGMTAKQQAALRANPRVAPVIDKIRARGTEDIDSDSLLDGVLV